MKIFKFFIKRIFLKRWILSISMILLLFAANYLTFTVARSILSTFQGYQEMENMDQEDIYIANLDPDSETNFDRITEKETQKVYDYLNSNFNYALYTDGFIISLPNNDDMEISLNYMNEEFYNLNQFELSQGTKLDFDYQFNKDEIPVLIGKGLSKTYPVGSTIKITDPVVEQPITLKVQGVLKQNAHHSNFYALNSKTYYNFSIFFPVNETFIKHANIDFHVNGLMDIIILQSTKERTVDLSEYIQKNLGLKFNFYSQKENNDFFKDYYLNSLKIISMITLILLVIITCLSIWNTLISIRLMLKDFTINLLIGLSYSKLRKILYSYFGILFFINLIVIFLITAYNRYGFWLKKDTFFATYGLFGLIGIDWLALLVVILFDIIIGMIIVQNMVRKIKKIPISLGVLQ
ncbi:ABC transporter permease [Garciella nitratireducens]|uniref:ABC transporter permease n=1 Tax=Garciella nitratireducens TaxID=218205 RepID=UPI000DE9E749|nr:ABC transporter permease [Garciella nitratireducens]RBP42295.1 MacB-like protein [Garciella nitratireducens]